MWQRAMHHCWKPRRAGCCQGTDPEAVPGRSSVFCSGPKVPSKPPEVGGWKLASSAQSRKKKKPTQKHLRRDLPWHLEVVQLGCIRQLCCLLHREYWAFAIETTELNYLKDRKYILANICVNSVLQFEVQKGSWELQLCCVTMSTYQSMFKDCNNKHIKWSSQALQMKRYQVPKILQSSFQTAATESLSYFLKAFYNAAVAAFSHLLQNL